MYAQPEPLMCERARLTEVGGARDDRLGDLLAEVRLRAGCRHKRQGKHIAASEQKGTEVRVSESEASAALSADSRRWSLARTHAPLSSASTIALQTTGRESRRQKKEQTQDQRTASHTRASRLELRQRQARAYPICSGASVLLFPLLCTRMTAIFFSPSITSNCQCALSPMSSGSPKARPISLFESCTEAEGSERDRDREHRGSACKSRTYHAVSDCCCSSCPFALLRLLPPDPCCAGCSLLAPWPACPAARVRRP